MADFSELSSLVGNNVSEEVYRAKIDDEVRQTLIKDIARNVSRVSVNRIMDKIADVLNNKGPQYRSHKAIAEVTVAANKCDKAYLRELLDIQKKYYPEDYDPSNERVFE